MAAAASEVDNTAVLKTKNASLVNEVERLTALLKQSERKRKKQKVMYEKSMENLGIRLVDFENSLRKEQRDIQELMSKKDQQIKVREELVKALQEKLDLQHCKQCGYPCTPSTIGVEWQLEIDEDLNQLVRKLPPLSLPPPEESVHIGFTNHRPFRPKSKLSPVAEESEVTFSSSLRHVHADINPDHFHAALTASLKVLNDPTGVAPSNSVDDKEEEKSDYEEEKPKVKLLENISKDDEVKESSDDASIINMTTADQDASAFAVDTMQDAVLVELNEADSTSTVSYIENKNTQSKHCANHNSSVLSTFCSQLSMDTMKLVNNSVREILNATTVHQTSIDAQNINSQTVLPETTNTENKYTDANPSLSSESVAMATVVIATEDALHELRTAIDSIASNSNSSTNYIGASTNTIDASTNSIDVLADSIGCYTTFLIESTFMNAKTELSQIYSTERASSQPKKLDTNAGFDQIDDPEFCMKNNNISMTSAGTEDATQRLFHAAEKVAQNVFPIDITQLVVKEKNKNNTFSSQPQPLKEEVSPSEPCLREETTTNNSSFDTVKETSSYDFCEPDNNDVIINKFEDEQRKVPPSLDADLEISVIVDTILQKVHKSVFAELRNQISKREKKNSQQINETVNSNFDSKQISQILESVDTNCRVKQESQEVDILSQQNMNIEPEFKEFVNEIEFITSEVKEKSQKSLSLPTTSATSATANLDEQPRSVDHHETTASTATTSSKRKSKNKKKKKRKKNNIGQQANLATPNDNAQNHIPSENDFSDCHLRSSDNSSSSIPTEEELTPKFPANEGVFSYLPMKSPEEDKYSLLVDEQLDVLDQAMSDEDVIVGESHATDDSYVKCDSHTKGDSNVECDSHMKGDFHTKPFINGLHPSAEQRPLDCNNHIIKNHPMSDHTENGVVGENDVVNKPVPKEELFIQGNNITTKM